MIVSQENVDRERETARCLEARTLNFCNYSSDLSTIKRIFKFAFTIFNRGYATVYTLQLKAAAWTYSVH